MPRPPRLHDRPLPEPQLGRERLPIIRGKTEGADCLRCPFSRNGRPNRPVVGEGPASPKWLVIGEGPGHNEVAMGRPFIGASGQMVNKALTAIHRPREQLWVSNVTLCLPTPNATDEEKNLARECCAPRFQAEILQWPDLPIIALGAVAARTFITKKFSINQMTGSYHVVNSKALGDRAVIPTIHPAAILRGGGGVGGAHAPDLAFWNLIYDMAKVDAIAAGKDIVFRENDIAIEYADPLRAERLVRKMAADARASGFIATDTETYVDNEKKHSALQPLNAKMSALGLATEGWGLSVAWGVMTPFSKRLVAAVFADRRIRKVMHNRLYDRPVLARHGLPVHGDNDDTMLMHHSAFPGLAHGLQRVATQYYAITPWKAEFRKGKDTPENLTRYNAKDTLVTARIFTPLSIAIKRTASERTYDVDLRSTEAAQLMHEKGVPISREVNQQLYDTFLSNMIAARKVLEDAVYDPKIQKKLWDRLAFEQAKRIRMADPDDFEERQKIRLAEIKKAHGKGRWEWKIGSGEHVAAYLKARGVPLYFMTPTGRTSTKKEIMEQFAHLPEVRSLLDYRENQKMFSTFCLAPGTRVLTSDLRWVSIETLVPGDELIGFDEELCGKSTKYRRSIVEATSRGTKHSYRITTDRGTVTASADHLWVAKNANKSGKVRSWFRTADLEPGNVICFAAEPWEEDEDKPCMHGHVLGGFSTSLRILGQFRPPRLLDQAASVWEGRSTGMPSTHPAEVLSIEDLGEQPVVAVRTTTRTFIAEGFLSHNCYRMFDRYDEKGNIVKYGYADADNRIHPRWSVHKITGRWGAEDPMAQNWPKADKKKGRPNLRSQVVAPLGRMFVGFDFAQLEARIIALMSGDPFLCEIFWNNRDIHSEFARIVWPDFDQQPAHERKILRDTIKRPEYGAFYGGQIDTLWKNVVKDFPAVKLADIARMVELMTSKMPGVTRWHQQLLRDVMKAPHELRSAVYGRRRCFPLGQADINDVYNFPVQCLRGDQRVLTTNGWQSISCLVPGVDVLQQPSSHTTSTFNLRSTGRRTVYALRTQGRSAVCTIEHRFLTYVHGGRVAWKKLRYLKPGDYIAINTSIVDGGHDPAGITPDLGEALGSLVGDGNYSGRGFVVTCTTKRYAQRLRGFLRGAWPDMNFLIRRTKRRQKTYKQLWTLSAESRLADARLARIGLKRTTAKTKTLPSWVETATYATRCALLRGLFDSDGGHGGVDVSFTSTSKVLAQTTQRLLFSVGIDARLYPLKGGVYRIIILPTHLRLFEDRVGFAYGVKRARLHQRKHKNPITPLPPDLVCHLAATLLRRLNNVSKSWSALDHARLHRASQGVASRQQLGRIFDTARLYVDVEDLERSLRFTYERIVSIRKQRRPAQTFDLEIPGDDHGYVAEGLITHNSTGADIMATGLFRIMPLLKKYHNCWPILQIHDAMVFECDEDDADLLKEDVRRSFEQEHTHNGVTISFPVDPEIGKSWASV